MYSALDIAAYIIAYCKSNNFVISNLRLQKILYFIQAEFLVATGNPCFREDIQAWDFGPVIPEVYQVYKFYGSSNIPDVYDGSNTFSFIKDKDKRIIQEMIEECNKFSAIELVNITHNQAPWKDVFIKYQNNKIENEEIRNYFLQD